MVHLDILLIITGSQINVSGKTVLIGETINYIIQKAEEDESIQSK